jgi:hypothetical protein
MTYNLKLGLVALGLISRLLLFFYSKFSKIGQNRLTSVNLYRVKVHIPHNSGTLPHALRPDFLLLLPFNLIVYISVL